MPIITIRTGCYACHLTYWPGPAGKVYKGPIERELESRADYPELRQLVADSYRAVAGRVVFSRADSEGALGHLWFQDAHGVHYHELLDSQGQGAEVALRVFLAPRDGARPGGGRTLVATWVAGGLSERKLKSAIRGAVDKRLVFERLVKAADPKQKGRGIYHQRVVIDDYSNIPGIVNTPYIRNGLPRAVISAIGFGVNDPSLDLPADNAPTFTASATLVEIKPGEKLYRVTNDPASEPFARTGGYWTRTPPANLAGVVGGTAVMPEWNSFQRVYEFTAPPYVDPAKQEPKLYAWEGPAAAQPVSGDYPEKVNNGYSLPGGDLQIFVPNKHSRDAKFGGTIQDITHTHKSW